MAELNAKGLLIEFMEQDILTKDLLLLKLLNYLPDEVLDSFMKDLIKKSDLAKDIIYTFDSKKAEEILRKYTDIKETLRKYTDIN